MIRKLIHACCAAAARRALPAHAALKVLATTADWGALATELGGDKVNVYTATNALQDVHQVDAKPSLVARARTADLVVANGAELEIGWLPVLLQESGNPKIQPGTPGLLRGDLGRAAARRPDRRRSLDGRHPSARQSAHPARPAQHRGGREGADARGSRPSMPPNAAYYQARGADFQARWQQAMTRWDAAGRAAQGRAGRRDPHGPGATCATGSA